MGGNSHTIMIACVSPADSNVDETVSTLRYADRARQIKNKPVVNRDEKDELVARLRQEIKELRAQGFQTGGGQKVDTKAAAELEIARKQIEQNEEETRHLRSELLACHEEMSNMNEQLLISEASREKLKNKLKELATVTDLTFSKLEELAIEKN